MIRHPGEAIAGRTQRGLRGCCAAIVACAALIGGFTEGPACGEESPSTPQSANPPAPIFASFEPFADESDKAPPSFGGNVFQDPPPVPTITTPPALETGNGWSESPASTPASPALGGSAFGIPLEASWANGLTIDSPKKDFHFHFGGVGQIDSVWFIGPASAFNAPGGAPSTVGNSSAMLLRRAILQADGDLWEQFDYSIQFDFANASDDNDTEQPSAFSNFTTSPAAMNIWIQVRDVPFFGYVRLGNQDKPIGFDNNTGAANLSFMERSDNQDAFYGPFDNGFALGLSAWNWNQSERMTWRYGIFRPATNVFGVALNKYSIGARVTVLPWYEDDGRELIHLGLGYWGGEVDNDELRDRARVLLRNAPGFAVPILVDTNELGGSHQYTFGPEFALVYGSLTVQAEYAGQFFVDATDTSGVNQGTVYYQGGYIEALYFLTGEVQPYDRRSGVFGRVIPLHDYHLKSGDPCCAFGAWQVGVRLSYVNLDDKDIQGGKLYDWTLGLNWFLNPNMKLQLNAIAEHRDVPGVTPGWISGIGVRAAYDF